MSPAVRTELTPLAQAVRLGLASGGQKTLPSKYLYDELGSALFEAICTLPEYGLTRADRRLVERNAAEIVASLETPVLVAELGSGSARKTRFILEALAPRATTYLPIDISAAALRQSERELGRLRSVTVVGLEREYLDGLGAVAERRPTGAQLLVLFLGSTIGNFDRTAARTFLGRVRATLEPGDLLLLSTDLVKPREQLVLAYDDPAGVTAAFDRNILARLNRELGADFPVRDFVHEARWNEAERRVEMHLRAPRDLTVRIPAAELEVAFEAGETIWTESSHKFELGEIRDLATAARFECQRQWVDDRWPFAQSLLRAG